MNNLVVHQICIAEDHPAASEWMDRLIALNPEFRHQLWSEDEVGSLGLDLPAMIAEYGEGGASNIIRLKAVLDYGGIYIDTEVEPLKPILSLAHFDAFAARQDTDRLCNAVFGATPNHPWIRWQYDRYHYNRGILPYWGVELMSTAPRAGITIVPTEWFYPYHWEAPPKKRVPHANSLLVHRWTSHRP